MTREDEKAEEMYGYVGTRERGKGKNVKCTHSIFFLLQKINIF